MPSIDLSDGDWSDLLERIANQRCTPFIGAGASYPTLPLAKDLAEQLLKKYWESAGKEQDSHDKNSESSSNPDYLFESKSDLMQVAQYIAIKKNDNIRPKEWIAAIIREKPLDDPPPDEPHEVLATLGLPVYITTNYDDFMINALRRRRALAKREFARWTRTLIKEHNSAFDSKYKPSAEAPIVFHLHGHTELPKAMVATEIDYLDFLVNTSVDLATAPRKPIIPFSIREALTGSTLLFVGYSLNDINFRYILHALFKHLDPAERMVNVAIQYAGTTPDNVRSYIREYFNTLFKVKVFHGTAQDFCSELKKRRDEYARSRSPFSRATAF